MAVYNAIIVGTDGSRTATQAVRRAAVMAAALSAPLVVATVYNRPRPEDLGPPSVRAQSPTDAGLSSGYRAAAETAQDAAGEARAAAGAALAAVATVTPEGDPAEKLIELAEQREGSLLVVGSQGMTGSQRFLLGNVPNKISHHAPGDVLILRTGEADHTRPPERVLVATDGSSTATRAVDRAVDLAAALGTRLTILTAGEAKTAGTVLDEACARATKAGVDAVPLHRTGEAAQAIVDAAADHDLTVVGSVGMTGASRFLLGSVPNKVSHHVTNDLLIVKTA